MHIPRALVSRDSTGSSTGTPQNLSLILGVALSIVAVLLVVFLIVWRIIIVKRRQEAAFSSTTHSESLSRPPEKFTSNTLRGFKLPNKSEPMQHPRIDPYVLPQPPAPTLGVASASADSFGNTASSDYHYKTWRTVASSRSIDDPHMFADRTSQTSARMQAREGLNATGEMKDLITMLNSQPIDSKAARNALSPTLAVKPMRPISVASTLVAPHTVTKDFGSMAHGLKRTHSVERTSDGYNSDATTTAQVPSVMRRPKFNPREGAPPIIPSIYFQPFELDNVPNTFLARSNSMDSRRTSTATAVAGPLRDRVLSQLGRTPSARQNYPPPTTRKRQNSEPPKIPALPRLSTITDGRVGTHTDSMMMHLTRSLAPRASVAPSVSEYPESRAGSIYVDPDMPLSHAPLSPTVVPSRNNSARSGWI